MSPYIRGTTLSICRTLSNPVVETRSFATTPCVLPDRSRVVSHGTSTNRDEHFRPLDGNRSCRVGPGQWIVHVTRGTRDVHDPVTTLGSRDGPPEPQTTDPSCHRPTVFPQVQHQTEKELGRRPSAESSDTKRYPVPLKYQPKFLCE